MKETIRGNYIELQFSPNELSDNIFIYTFPDGYSFQEIYYNTGNSIVVNFPNSAQEHFKFPVVNGKSPCSLKLFIRDLSKSAYMQFLIEKFGSEPDLHYFDKKFEPLLIKRKDGTKYNLIPTRDKGGD